jgi:hypothetical protein
VSDLTDAQKKELRVRGGVRVERSTARRPVPACAKVT